MEDELPRLPWLKSPASATARVSWSPPGSRVAFSFALAHSGWRERGRWGRVREEPEGLWEAEKDEVVCAFPSSYGEMLAFTLTAFLELMDHGLVPWDTVSIGFIKQVPSAGGRAGMSWGSGPVLTGSSLCRQIAGYVSQPTVDVSILQRSLAILESMVLNSQALYQKIAEEVTVGQLLSHLQV